ncbi:uncharacterized protein LOC121249068 [Juglans microcarpa x Juglans regia]|uniref:uncharacterized protein LOC121249068 n=1 Tax=Juglans microcarpa x Juglans regia TaxID=2249226 RepID=UPI001B7E518E|nr:uncharacterized protein LOC121249068 [Juglans microcarpa x Juglans regia]
MHGYHGMMPPTFFPPFAPRPNADPYSWRNEQPTGVPFRLPIAYQIPYPGYSSNPKDMTKPSSSTRRSLFSSESNTYQDSSNVGDEFIEQEQASQLQDEVLSGAPRTDEVLSTSGVAATTDEVLNTSSVAVVTYEVLNTSGVAAVTDEILNTSGVQAATTDEVVFHGTQQSVISQVNLQHC